MATALRSARGLPDASTACDACDRIEFLGHVLQVCPRTHASRVARHNRVVELAKRELCKKGWSCMVEPAIPIPAGIRRPDLLFHRPSGPAYVIDATIVADNADLTGAHQRKCAYYDTLDIRQWVYQTTNADRVHFSSIKLNWRGLLAVPTGHTLCNEMGVSEYVLP